MRTPDTKEPSPKKSVVAGMAGIVTALGVYGAELYVGVNSLVILRALFQSPDQFTSTVGFYVLPG